MFSKNSFTLLRIPFSFFLMPVYFFALSQCDVVNKINAALIFVILHLFIYPASNGYNSYQDKDEGSIGGLKHPPKATKDLFYLSLVFDCIGLALSLIIGIPFLIGILAYMLVSRAYSSKIIRLKKYPILGFLAVFVFQGAVSFLNIYCGISGNGFEETLKSPLLYPILASSFLIGGVYPLTQIYQHKQDAAAGDTTISMLLGYKGTFIFCALMFGCANGILWKYFNKLDHISSFVLLQCFLIPVIAYFLKWMFQVVKSSDNATFERTMLMNMLASLMMNSCFLILYVFKV